MGLVSTYSGLDLANLKVEHGTKYCFNRDAREPNLRIHLGWIQAEVEKYLHELTNENANLQQKEYLMRVSTYAQ